jgi:hypothetical protein
MAEVAYLSYERIWSGAETPLAGQMQKHSEAEHNATRGAQLPGWTPRKAWREAFSVSRL